MPYTCLQEKKARSPALGKYFSDRPFLFLFTLSLIYCLCLASAWQSLQLSAQSDIPDATKYVCKTRAANKIKLPAQRPAVIQSWREITRDYYFIKKYFSSETGAYFSRTFGCVLIYLPPCMDLVFHCHFIEKSDKCQWPKLQDTYAYSVIATESLKSGPSKEIYVCCFFDFYCCAFIWNIRHFIFNLVYLFEDPT